MYLAIPLCAMSFLNCFPSKVIVVAASVALAAANVKFGASDTRIITLPPFVKYSFSFNCVAQWKIT